MKLYAILVGLLIALIIALVIQPHWLADIRGWLGMATNKDGTSYDSYQALSGFVPALAITALVASGIQGFRHLNCAHKGCWRTGHQMPKGYRLCKIHSEQPIEDLNVHDIHESHQL